MRTHSIWDLVRRRGEMARWPVGCCAVTIRHLILCSCGAVQFSVRWESFLILVRELRWSEVKFTAGGQCNVYVIHV
jgi:hypothetical protein